MTGENSISIANTEQLGKFVRKFFEETYEQERLASERRAAGYEETIKTMKPWFDKKKELLSPIGLYYLNQLHYNSQEATYRYLLSMMVVLAQAFEGLTRNATAEDKTELAKRFEELAKKGEEEKQKIDEHFAKRMAELFGKGGEGYIG
jgi:hypothetical protein